MNAEKESMTLSSEEMLGQMHSMIVAGHETTATALSWALLYLVDYPAVQERLRSELIAEVPDLHDQPFDKTQGAALDKLANLSYLDAFVKELLRVQSPVSGLLRVAEKEDVIPLKKPIKGSDGRLIHELKIQAGQSILVGIYSANRDTEIWGEDAKEFRPERWLGKTDATVNEEEQASVLRSITPWSSLLSFAGGPRSCIGYRFAILEIKVGVVIWVKYQTS